MPAGLLRLGWVDMQYVNYMALLPDSFCDWSVKNHMEDLAHEDTQKHMCYWHDMCYWHERAVDEQKKALRDYKKKVKAQEPPKIETVPMIIESIVDASAENDKDQGAR